MANKNKQFRHMKTLKYKIPYYLLYSRLFVAILMVVLSFVSLSPIIVVSLVIYAVLSDVFDGIIARQLNISTVEMRRLDTKIDTVFWFSCLFYLCFKHSLFFKLHLFQVIILISSELFIIAFGRLKFKERISFHTIFSKFWALILLWFFLELTLTQTCVWSFKVAFWYGLFVQTEIFIIALILKENQTDVPFVWQAVRLKNGQILKRNKLFNG